LKRIFLFICLTLFVWQLPALSQEAAKHESKGEQPHETLWKTVNFIILAGALGYLIGKNGGAFFQGRDTYIRKGLEDAAKISAEAEVRTAEISHKLAQLESEIAELRRGAKTELEADQQRAREETTRILAKVNAHAHQDIEAAGKAARQQLKAYAADLSVKLAEGQLRSQMNAGAEDALLSAFVDDLRGKKRAEAQ
jgi:F0F1-type ATP synthase membrane subunit b/b'